MQRKNLTLLMLVFTLLNNCLVAQDQEVSIDLEVSTAPVANRLELYTSGLAKFLVRNTGAEKASNIVLRFDKYQLNITQAPTVSQGLANEHWTTSPYWTVGDLEPGASAVITYPIFTLGESYQLFAQVETQEGVDEDSTPNNAVGRLVGEDDEAVYPNFHENNDLITSDDCFGELNGDFFLCADNGVETADVYVQSEGKTVRYTYNNSANIIATEEMEVMNVVLTDSTIVYGIGATPIEKSLTNALKEQLDTIYEARVLESDNILFAGVHGANYRLVIVDNEISPVASLDIDKVEYLEGVEHFANVLNQLDTTDYTTWTSIVDSGSLGSLSMENVQASFQLMIGFVDLGYDNISDIRTTLADISSNKELLEGLSAQDIETIGDLAYVIRQFNGYGFTGYLPIPVRNFSAVVVQLDLAGLGDIPITEVDNAITLIDILDANSVNEWVHSGQLARLYYFMNVLDVSQPIDILATIPMDELVEMIDIANDLELVDIAFTEENIAVLYDDLATRLAGFDLYHSAIEEEVLEVVYSAGNILKLATISQNYNSISYDAALNYGVNESLDMVVKTPCNTLKVVTAIGAEKSKYEYAFIDGLTLLNDRAAIDGITAYQSFVSPYVELEEEVFTLRIEGDQGARYLDFPTDPAFEFDQLEGVAFTADNAILFGESEQGQIPTYAYACSSTGVDLNLSVSTINMPSKYEHGMVTYVLTNEGATPATEISVEFSKLGLNITDIPTVSQGTLEYLGDYIPPVWNLDRLDAGATAVILVPIYTLEDTYSLFGEVIALGEADEDSTPNNGNGSEREDDEALYENVFARVSSFASSGGSSRPGISGVYPNPTKADLKLSLLVEQDMAECMIAIYDQLNRVVLSKETALLKGQNEIDLEVGSLDVGVYFIVVPTKEGQVSHKFLKMN